MIVVDTNIMAYLFIPGERTSSIKDVFRKDPDWISPVLWKSEFRNVLTLYMRQGHLSLEQALKVLEEAESLMKGKEFLVPSHAIINLVPGCSCSAYDLEFVALALARNVVLISTDKRILSDFPERAFSPEKFLNTI